MIRLLLTIFCSAACLAALPSALPAARASALANLTTSGTPDLRLFVESQAAQGIGSGARVEVTLGELNPRLQLAPCARIEPFLPANARLWGRSSVGLRCTQGATWSVQMPVTVRVFGPALVANRPLAPNTPLTDADFTVDEVEWTREPQGVATDAAQIDQRVLTRAVATGQPVPLAALRAPQVIAAGDPVKLLGQGKGFAITAQAVALASAQDGQSVRVRTDSGRILTGTARSGRRVEVAF
jgi:flagellar basal body P-ring formation protein FlgA